MPKYKHDCDKCVYLGPYQNLTIDPDVYDLYFCLQGGHLPTIVGRYGNEGNEYCSGLFLGGPYLAEGRKRTEWLGLLQTHQTPRSTP